MCDVESPAKGSERANGASFAQVWLLFRDGSRRSITSDLTDYWELSLSANGDSFVTVQRQVVGKISVLRKGETRPTAISTGTSRFYQKENSRWRLKVIDFQTGATTNVFDVAPAVQVQWDSPLRWTPDGSYLTYVDHSSGFDNIWGQPIAGGTPRQLTSFENSLIFSFDWMKDGSLVASRGVLTSDVVLIKDANR
jgi:hypothetical protein